MSDRPLPPGSAFDPDEQRELDALGITPGTRRHPDPAMLVAFDEGVVLDLDEDTAAWLRAHRSGCPACQTAVADLVRALDEDASPETKKRIDARLAVVRRAPAKNLWRWLVPVGGLTLATAGLTWMLMPADVASPVVPESQIAKTTPPVPTVFGIDRPAIPPGELTLATRGEAMTPAEVSNQAALALDRADSGDVKAAIAELDALVKKHPQARRAGLALGALLLRDNRNADALAILERARLLKTDADMDDEVDWYLAIARIRTGDRAGATLLLEGVCKRGGPRSARACTGVAEIDRLPSGR